MTPFTQTKLNLPKPKKFIAGCMLKYGVTRAQAKIQYNTLKADKIFVNDTYQVNISDKPPWNQMGCAMLHISIKRLDKGPAVDWRHFQQIKNELVGPNHEAFELYPNEDRLVDCANQFHLWCFAEPDVGMPIGFPTRAVESIPPDPTVTQRPITEAEINEDHAQAMMASDGETSDQQITIDQILEAAAMMDAADVPEDDRMVSLIDPDTGQYVDTDTNPERVMEIIQKFVGEQEIADVVDIKERTAEAEGEES